MDLNLPENHSFNKLYIPTLRGLRKLADGRDVYLDRTIKDYFKESDKSPIIFTGLSLFAEYRKLLLGTYQQRQWVREFEEFVGKTFFHDRTITLIPRDESESLEIKIGNEKQRPVSELGDGIHFIINLIFPLFQRRNESLLVFFEEPELCLHPAFQRVFLNTLTSNRFPNHQYFLTTHSNHFLDLTADIDHVSVFTFHRRIHENPDEEAEHDTTFEIENVSNDNVRSLELLGVRNSSVFLSNCTIWVEGITDRRYFAKWLELYTQHQNKRAFREDLHFSFVEYSGANITHWSFLDRIEDPIEVKRLCGRLFLIRDGDEAKEGSKKCSDNQKLTNKLGDRFQLLPCREVENLLTPRAIREVVADYEEGCVEFNDFSQEEYQSAYLGSFIDEKVIKGNSPRKHRYAKRSDAPSTLKDKVEFCSRALERMEKFSELSQDAQTLTERLYNFIEANNK